MTELCPPLVADDLRRSLIDYLVTTFALTDDDAQASLSAFLTDPVDGIFKGPFLRTSLPFSPAPRYAENALAWMPEGFRPYTHQAAAFERLNSARPGGPQPTLVVTGTGSGKTESFLIPILDHVVRANAAGITGIKALILYPMNALADDQAGRLAHLITTEPALAGVRAGIYTGEASQGSGTRTVVSERGLITDRTILRSDPPDILLTNYKMLDQLLLRGEDQRLWAASADSLQYLVLDEIHTYDGAQGTDVAMLLRRLAWTLNNQRTNPSDAHHPLRPITPVGTSATLGSNDESDQAMREFAQQVFGEVFDETSIIREQRLDHDEWAEGAEAEIARMRLRPSTINSVTAVRLADEVRGMDVADLSRRLLAGMYEYIDPNIQDRRYQYTDTQLLSLIKAHPFISDYLAATARATDVRLLAESLLPGSPDTLEARIEFLTCLHAALAHVRTVLGRIAPNTETHLWIRELTRVDRLATAVPQFIWSDDGPRDQPSQAFPAIYCRRCGRSGWGVQLASTGTDLAAAEKDKNIRANHARHEGRFRALISAPTEGALAVTGGAPTAGLTWFDPANRAFTATPAPDDPAYLDSRLLPVLTVAGPDPDGLSAKDQCPSCGAEDAIRFQGSAIATLLSVSLSTVFGEPHLDRAEKKALVFTDSVQDAAHRAGFVTARSRSLAFRTMLRSGLSAQPRTLDQLIDGIITAAEDDPSARYRLLPPVMADNEAFRPYWKAAPRDVPLQLAAKVRARLLLDASLEFGLVSRYGRTLEQTGSAWAQVDAGSSASLAALARSVLANDPQQALDQDLTSIDAAVRVRWVRGVLERMRMQGAIDHEWFARFMESDGAPYMIWGGRRPKDAMPAFTPWRSRPAFPRTGRPGDKSLLDPTTTAQSWYARWTSRVLGVDAGHGAVLMRGLLAALEDVGIITGRAIAGGEARDRVYAIPTQRLMVAATSDQQTGQVMLRCDVCHTRHAAGPDTVRELDGGPCLVGRCPGTLGIEPVDKDNFYRRMYTGGQMERILAKEHTSLVDTTVRKRYEREFKEGATTPGAPNVLVATPTLEMGIDIGDLSAVFLSSLPRSVANYVQRVGRAGRANGNALDVAMATGRGEHLPRLNDPSSLINGAVRPPATYLSAVEITRRQFIASLADARAREIGESPLRAGEVMTLAPGSLLADLIERAEAAPDGLVDQFASGFEGIFDETFVQELRDWVRPVSGPETSGLARYIGAAVHRWEVELEDLRHQRDAIEKSLPNLTDLAAGSSQGSDPQIALHEAKAALAYLRKRITERSSDYWIQPLELYGLFPNYTLIDDQVELDVQVSWFDEDAHEYRNEPYTYTRGSARALGEFAPGSTFYVDGHRIRVDSLDLGNQGQYLRTWALCSECGYHEDITGGHKQPTQCPRCGGSGIADVGQKYDVVELTRASAQVNRDGSNIDDADEDRVKASFTIVPMADINPKHIADQWFAENVGFGITYAQRLDLVWLNLGPRGGTTQQIGGHRVDAPLFRVCETCGHLDEPNAPASRSHRPWCRHRNDVDDHARQIALSRSMTTQGLVLTLPWQIAAGDMFAVPSLRAALRLGMEKAFGGTPDHLGVASIKAPSGPGQPVLDGLLIHDLVPGGTGYLADVARPEKLWEILTRAYLTVRDCPCQSEGRMACHRCLLPFADWADLDLVSRTSAERSLHDLLGGDVAASSEPGWKVTDQAPQVDPDDESFLEKRFRQAFITMVKAAGGSCHEQVTSRGNIITASFGSVSWRLEPQVNMLGSRPDFVLRGANMPDLAIFTDGYSYHATVAVNRLADDATKRQILRGAGIPVLAVTMDDIVALEKADARGLAAGDPFWFSRQVMDGVKTLPVFSFNQDTQQAVLDGPFGILKYWMTAHTDAVPNLTAFGSAAPMGMSQAGTPCFVDAGRSLAQVARELLDGEHSPGQAPNAWWWRDGALSVLVRAAGATQVSIDVLVVLDDDPVALDHRGFKQAWQDWLELSNVLALRDVVHATQITTTSLLPALAGDGAEMAQPVAQPGELSAEWLDMQQELGAEVAFSPEFFTQLADAGLPLPQVGEELGPGILVDLSWPQQRIAVMVTPEDRDVDDLAEEGWRLLPADVTVILEAMEEHRG